MIPISYTSLSKWMSCPRHWHVVYVGKTKDTGTKSTFAGSAEHKKLEAAVMGGAPSDNTFAQTLINSLRGAPGKVEAEKWLTVNRDLTHAPYGVTPWMRVSVDAMWTSPDGRKVTIIDWKTGNWAPNTPADVDFTQLRMYAAAALGVKTKAAVATVAMAYTSKQRLFPLVVKREEVAVATRSPEYVKLFGDMARHEAAQSGTDFPAIAGRMCTYCPDATCEHNPGYDS